MVVYIAMKDKTLKIEAQCVTESCLCNTLVKRIRSGKQERGTDNFENILKKT